MRIVFLILVFAVGLQEACKGAGFLLGGLGRAGRVLTTGSRAGSRGSVASGGSAALQAGSRAGSRGSVASGGSAALQEAATTGIAREVWRATTFRSLRRLFKPDKMRDLPEDIRDYIDEIPDEQVLDVTVRSMMDDATLKVGKGVNGFDESFWTGVVSHMRTQHFVQLVSDLATTSLQKVGLFKFEVTNFRSLQKDVDDIMRSAITLVEQADDFELPQLVRYATTTIVEVVDEAVMGFRVGVDALVPNLQIKYAMPDDLLPTVEKAVKAATKAEKRYHKIANSRAATLEEVHSAFHAYANKAAIAADKALDAHNNLYLLAADSTRQTVAVLERGGTDKAMKMLQNLYKTAKLVLEKVHNVKEVNRIHKWLMTSEEIEKGALYATGDDLAKGVVRNVDGEVLEGEELAKQLADNREAAELWSIINGSKESMRDAVKEGLTQVDDVTPHLMSDADVIAREMRRGEQAVSIEYAQLPLQENGRRPGFPAAFAQVGETLQSAWQRWNSVTRKKKATYIFILASIPAIAAGIAEALKGNGTVEEEQNWLNGTTLDNMSDIDVDEFVNIFTNLPSEKRNSTTNSTTGKQEDIDFENPETWSDDDYNYIDTEPNPHFDYPPPPLNSRGRRLRRNEENGTHSFHYLTAEGEEEELWLVRRILPARSEIMNAVNDIIETEKALAIRQKRIAEEQKAAAALRRERQNVWIICLYAIVILLITGALLFATFSLLCLVRYIIVSIPRCSSIYIV